MDAFLAVVSSRADDVAPTAASEALERLWPEQARQTALFADRGVLLALSRVGGVEASLPAPAITIGPHAVIAKRWDWSSSSGPAAGHVEWAESLGSIGASAPPPAGIPACLAWLPASRTLVVLRDALGEGPIWHAADGVRLAVSSHPAMLQALPWVRSEPDEVAIALAGFAGAPGEISPWRAVRRLPAGHRLTWSNERGSVDRWWQVGAPPAPRRIDDAEWPERARLALERAVARRVPSAGSVGAQLSGGLDSTAVSLLAARLLLESGRSLHTFSHLPTVRWTPPRPGDESPYVESALSRMPNAIPHVCTDRGGNGARFDGRPLLAHDHAVRDAARRAGVGVMLSGWGGDEGVSFNGDGFLAGELLRLRFLPALRWCWQFGGGRLRGMAGAILYKFVYQQLGFLRPTPVHQDPSRESRREHLRRLSGASREVARRGYRASRRLRAAASAHENQRRLLTSPHIGNRIDADAEWSIPAGFCFRYPLLDPEVIQVALQVPERLFVLDGRTRTLIREAMRGLYPDLIQDRRGKFVSHPRAPTFRPLE